MPCLILSGADTGWQCTPVEDSPKASPTPGLQVGRCHAGTSCVNVASPCRPANGKKHVVRLSGSKANQDDQDMAKLGEDIIGTSGLPPFFSVSNADEVTIDAPECRKGDALRTWVRSLSGFQKEALVRSADKGRTWRLVSDEGAVPERA